MRAMKAIATQELHFVDDVEMLIAGLAVIGKDTIWERLCILLY